MTNTAITALAKAFLLLIPLVLPQIRPETPVSRPNEVVQGGFVEGALVVTKHDRHGMAWVQFHGFGRSVFFNLR